MIYTDERCIGCAIVLVLTHILFKFILIHAMSSAEERKARKAKWKKKEETERTNNFTHTNLLTCIHTYTKPTYMMLTI